MMPIKRTPPYDRVDTAAPERQTMPTTARRTSTTEVVLRGVSREPDGRARELILYTDQAMGKQSVRYRIQTGGQELTARNEGLTLFTSSPVEEAKGRGLSQRGPRLQGDRTRKSRSEIFRKGFNWRQILLFKQIS